MPRSPARSREPIPPAALIEARRELMKPYALAHEKSPAPKCGAQSEVVDPPCAMRSTPLHKASPAYHKSERRASGASFCPCP
jgi:hypothetical protein